MHAESLEIRWPLSNYRRRNSNRFESEFSAFVRNFIVKLKAFIQKCNNKPVKKFLSFNCCGPEDITKANMNEYVTLKTSP